MGYVDHFKVWRWIQVSVVVTEEHVCQVLLWESMMIRGAARVLLVRVFVHFATEAAALQDIAHLLATVCIINIV